MDAVYASLRAYYGASFFESLERPIEAKPAIPPFVTKLVFPIRGLFNENIRDMSAMIKWIEKNKQIEPRMHQKGVNI